jgi:hypothetical protein
MADACVALNKADGFTIHCFTVMCFLKTCLCFAFENKRARVNNKKEVKEVKYSFYPTRGKLA